MMETPLALLILGVSIELLIKRDARCCVLWGLMLFIRLELVVFWAILICFAVISKKIAWKKIVLGCLLGALPFLAFDLYFFGTPIPNTTAAKSKVYSLTTADSINSAVLTTTPTSFLTERFPEAKDLIFASIPLAGGFVADFLPSK